MQSILQLTFKTRLRIGFLGIVISVLLAMIISIVSQRQIVKVNQDLDRTFRTAKLVADFRADNTRVRTLIFEAINSEQKNARVFIEEVERTIDKLFLELDQIEAELTRNEEALQQLKSIRQFSESSRKLRFQQVEYIKNGEYARAAELFRGASYSAYETVYQQSISLEKLAHDHNQTLQQRANNLAKNSSYLQLLAGVISLAITLFISLSIFNMSSRISKELKDGIGVLGGSASEITTTVAEISTGAAETATAISETTTTVEEIRQTSMLAGQKAKRLLDTSQKAADIGEQGLETTAAMVESMKKIDAQMLVIQNIIMKLADQNRSIGDITASVSDIADQSNLLAVNAAIEAAKAGEQGRGFSVVAHEIRSLADQSKKSTAQVKEILNEIQKSVSLAVEAIRQGKDSADEGTKMAQQDREVVEMLIESVNEAVEASVQIASSSQQQIAGMDQIVPAMENIKQASEQNVAGIMQTQDAARSLNELGSNLKNIVERYRL